MKVFRWLFPFAFRRHDLAEYTTQTLFVGISLVLSAFLALLFLQLGGVWMYFSIPFWVLFLYDLLAALFSALCFFEVVSAAPTCKQAASRKAEGKAKQQTNAAPTSQTPSAHAENQGN